MEKTKIRTYHLDGDTLNAALRYDELTDLWIEEYIDFESIPRYTPNCMRQQLLNIISTQTIRQQASKMLPVMAKPTLISSEKAKSLST